MSSKKITFVSVSREADEKRKILNKPIDELEISVRATTACRFLNIKTLGELVQKSEGEILRAPNCGRKTLNEFKEIVQDTGFSLGYKSHDNFMVWKIHNTIDDDLLPGAVFSKQDILKFLDEKKYDEYEIVMRQEKGAEIYVN